MESQEFINAIKLAVRDAAVSGHHQPARTATWQTAFRIFVEKCSLVCLEEERRRLFSVVQEAVDQAVFGFLCVIDGVRAIEDGEKEGTARTQSYQRQGNTP